MIIGNSLLYERIDFHQIATDMVKAYKLKSKVKFKPGKNKAGNRIYKDKDIKIIRHIQTLLYEKKFTIKGAQQFLADYYLNKSNSSAKIINISSNNINNELLLDLKEKLNETIDLINKLKKQ